MRQQSAAIALFLGTASARVGLSSTNNINAPFPDYAGTASVVIPLAITSVKLTPTLSITTPTQANSSCVGCLRAGNIWCAAKIMTDFTTANWKATVTVKASDKTFVDDTSIDTAQCCWLQSDSAKDPFMPPGWLNNVPTTAGSTILTTITSSSGASVIAYAALFNKWTCQARISSITPAVMCDGTTPNCTTAGTVGVSTNFAEATTSWWCSNGRTNTANGGTAASAGSWTIQPYSPAKVTITTLAGWTNNANTVYPNSTGDLRLDLMLVSCRQDSTICGGASAITGLTKVATGSTAQQRTVGALTSAMKCTFVYTSTYGAPTFKAEKNVSTKMLELYDLHYAEYSDNSGQPAVTTAKVFYPTGTWSTLKARIYDTTAATQYAGWIVQPNVWGWQAPGAASTAVNTVAKAWFPVAMAAAQVTNQKTINSTYTGLVSTYDGLRTTYDAAIKPSTKKPDFFATLFNPPKKTTVPLRPAKPNRPLAYGGVYQQPWVKTNTAASAQTTRALVGNNEFVVSGAMGGWGGFTLGLLSGTVLGTGPIQKSYGVFGWSVDAAVSTTYKAEEQSFTQEWLDMCFAASGSNGNCPTGMTAPTVTGTNSPATTKTSILAVSVWANSGAAVAFGSTASSLKLTFSTNNWAQNAATWAKPPQPAAATALSTPAGAKVLAASVAAAAAVAAALY